MRLIERRSTKARRVQAMATKQFTYRIDGERNATVMVGDTYRSAFDGEIFEVVDIDYRIDGTVVKYTANGRSGRDGLPFEIDGANVALRITDDNAFGFGWQTIN
jgi:hypothetical protein